MVSKFCDVCNKIYLILMSIALVILTLTTIFVWIRDSVLFVPLCDVSPIISSIFFCIYVKGAYDIFLYLRRRKARIK